MIEREIRDIFGDRSSFEEIDRICYSYDATGISIQPDGVVFPENEGEVRDLIALANRVKIPLIPRGAGSGFTGGSVPVDGGVVVSFEKMNRILDIDELNMTATVMPGVILADLKREVEKMGLFYPPDPASMNFCTLGGNIAECAGGPSAFKYGVTKQYVLSLRNVLPTGETLHTGVNTVKGVVGYDLTGLIVGSEGTLTVVTEGTLRLIPRPELFSTFLVGFKNTESACEAINTIVEHRIVPSSLEIMDRSAVQCVREYGDYEVDEDAGCYLLLELDGFEDEVKVRERKLHGLIQDMEAISVENESEEEKREKLWDLRRAISPSLLKVNPKKINEDITVPRTKLPEMMRRLGDLSTNTGIPIVSFGHGGDGNIHVNIMIDDSLSGEVEKGEEIVRKLFSLTVKMGGTISGEHGVGMSKKPYITMELDERQIAVMKSIKKLFDPHNILNPHKIFP